MGWEARGSNRYYYKKKRISRKVVSEYMGRTPDAYRTASEVEEQLQHEQLERNEREKATTMENAINQLVRESKALVKGVLLASGYHQHRGEWRYRRET